MIHLGWPSSSFYSTTGCKKNIYYELSSIYWTVIVPVRKQAFSCFNTNSASYLKLNHPTGGSKLLSSSLTTWLSSPSSFIAIPKGVVRHRQYRPRFQWGGLSRSFHRPIYRKVRLHYPWLSKPVIRLIQHVKTALLKITSSLIENLKSIKVVRRRDRIDLQEPSNNDAAIPDIFDTVQRSCWNYEWNHWTKGSTLL